MTTDNPQSLLSFAPLRSIFLDHAEAMEAYETLLAASSLPEGPMTGPNFLLSVLAAFQTAYRDLLGVEYLYIVRTVSEDPLLDLRDQAKADKLRTVERWPTDDEIRAALPILLVTGFAYDFPLARRYCRAPADLHKRQTRLAGWGSAYFHERLGGREPFQQLYHFSELHFRERLQPITSRIIHELKMVETRRLNDMVGWVAP